MSYLEYLIQGNTVVSAIIKRYILERARKTTFDDRLTSAAKIYENKIKQYLNNTFIIYFKLISPLISLSAKAPGSFSILVTVPRSPRGLILSEFRESPQLGI